MKLETAKKRLAYEESIWAIKEIDLIEENRKLELEIGTCLYPSVLTTSSPRTICFGERD
jgi:hypothetical protein